MIQEREFQSHGLQAIAIKANTISAARLRGEDLWITAREDVSMLCLSPEQLISKGFADLLEHKPFWNRFCALVVDEIHLLYLWGTSFRLVFHSFDRDVLRGLLPWVSRQPLRKVASWIMSVSSLGTNLRNPTLSDDQTPNMMFS